MTRAYAGGVRELDLLLDVHPHSNSRRAGLHSNWLGLASAAPNSSLRRLFLPVVARCLADCGSALHWRGASALSFLFCDQDETFLGGGWRSRLLKMIRPLGSGAAGRVRVPIF